MSLSDRIDAAVQGRTLDLLCAPVTRLPAWAHDGTALGLLLSWGLTRAAGQALAHMIGHAVPTSDALRHVIAVGIRYAGAAADPAVARGSRRAAWYADWLSAHNLPHTAMRVRAVNGLAAPVGA